MKNYVFVGGLPSHIVGVVSFTKFGQRAELREELAQEAAAGGCVILPESDPAAQAFTPVELAKYASFGSHKNAPAEFLEKKHAAILAFAAFQASLEKESN